MSVVPPMTLQLVSRDRCRSCAAKPAVLSMRKTTVSPGVTSMSRICSPSCRKRMAASASSSMTRASPLGARPARARPALPAPRGGGRFGLSRLLGRGRLRGCPARRQPRQPRRCPAWCSSGRHGAAELQVADVVGHHPLELLDAGRPVGDADIGAGRGHGSARRPRRSRSCARSRRCCRCWKTTVSPGVTGMSGTGWPLPSVKRRALSACSSMTRASPLGGSAGSSGSAGASGCGGRLGRRGRPRGSAGGRLRAQRARSLAAASAARHRTVAGRERPLGARVAGAGGQRRR